MKFTVGDFDIDIKAKFTFEDRNNKQAVMYFMNQLCIWMSESAKYTVGCYGISHPTSDTRELFKACGENLLKQSSDLYEQLSAMGCYDEIRNER